MLVPPLSIANERVSLSEWAEENCTSCSSVGSYVGVGLIHGKGAKLGVIRHRFACLVVVRPVVLRDQGVVFLHFLLTIRQGDGAVRVHLSSSGALTYLLMYRCNGVRDLLHAHGRALLGVGVVRHRGRLFLRARFFLANNGPRRVRVVSHRVVFALSRPPIGREGEGASEGRILLREVPMDVSRFVHRLIGTRANVGTNVRAKFFLYLIRVLFHFRRVLPLFRRDEVVLFNPRRHVVCKGRLSYKASQCVRFGRNVLVRVRGKDR